MPRDFAIDPALPEVPAVECDAVCGASEVLQNSLGGVLPEPGPGGNEQQSGRCCPEQQWQEAVSPESQESPGHKDRWQQDGLHLCEQQQSEADSGESGLSRGGRFLFGPPGQQRQNSDGPHQVDCGFECGEASVSDELR